MKQNKILILRFSSLGDIAQALPSAQMLKENSSRIEVHWLTRSDFADVVSLNPAVDKVWAFHAKNGLWGLLKLTRHLAKENFTLIYDAHNNLRSFIVRTALKMICPKVKTIIRSKHRLKRFLLFTFRLNLFEKPFRGSYSYLYPLKSLVHEVRWPKHYRLNSPGTLNASISSHLRFPIAEYYVFAPSAAWELKRWPIEYWVELIRSLKNKNVIILGGPQDQFCQQIADSSPDDVVNLAGKLSWVESNFILQNCKAVVSGDTGILHLADTQNINSIALIGPTAFGHPSQATTVTLETELPCRPCTKDGRNSCHNKVYKKCLMNLKPSLVVKHLESSHDVTQK